MAAAGEPIPTQGAMPVGKKQRGQLSPAEAALSKAWVEYFAVFKKITTQVCRVPLTDPHGPSYNHKPI